MDKLLKEPIEWKYAQWILMLQYWGYVFNRTEINAYIRSWHSRVMRTAESGHQRMGITSMINNPLLCQCLLISSYYKMPFFGARKSNCTDEEWKNLADFINGDWSRKILGSKVSGADGYEIVKNTIKRLYKEKAVPIFKECKSIANEYGLRMI